MSQTFPSGTIVELAVTLRDGKTHTRRVAAGEGSPLETAANAYMADLTKRLALPVGGDTKQS